MNSIFYIAFLIIFLSRKFCNKLTHLKRQVHIFTYVVYGLYLKFNYSNVIISFHVTILINKILLAKIIIVELKTWNLSYLIFKHCILNYHENELRMVWLEHKIWLFFSSSYAKSFKCGLSKGKSQIFWLVFIQ